MAKTFSLTPLKYWIAALVAVIAHAATWSNTMGQTAQNNNAQNSNGLVKPARAPVNYWLIKSLSMRTLACLCANRYPVGFGAGKNAAFTYRIIRNSNNEESAVHSLCIKKNADKTKRILGHITLSLVKGGTLQIRTPGDDRYNPGAAVLRETLRGASLIPFKRQGYRLSRCPTQREHYQGLNWAEPERWPEM